MAMAWKVYDGPQINPMFSGIVCMISASDRLIAVITDDETPVSPDQWSGIASLIGAAPEMLYALKDCTEILFHLSTAGSPPSRDEAIDAVRERALAAVTKAEGRKA